MKPARRQSVAVVEAADAAVMAATVETEAAVVAAVHAGKFESPATRSAFAVAGHSYDSAREVPARDRVFSDSPGEIFFRFRVSPTSGITRQFACRRFCRIRQKRTQVLEVRDLGCACD